MDKKPKVTYRLNSAKLRKAKEVQVLDVVFDEITSLPDGEVIISPMTKAGVKAVHKDLLDKLQLLVPHFLVLCELRPVKDFKKAYFQNNEALTDMSIESFKVTGIHIKENQDTRQIIIVGRKVLKSGRVISMVAPLQTLAEVEDGYQNVDLLSEAVNGFMAEAELNLGGKWAPNPQTSMQDQLDATVKNINDAKQPEAVAS